MKLRRKDREKESSARPLPGDWEETERRIKAHRKRKVCLSAAAIIICAAAVLAFHLYASKKTYTDYNVSESTDRSGSDAVKLLEFNGNILKYSSEGASCTTVENETIWNQAYDMEDPVVSICGDYAAIADRSGKEIYILDSDGLESTISVAMPIIKAEVASQGSVAVLMEEDDVSYLQLYNKSGDLIAEGALYADNSGVPLDIALSYDASTLAAAVMDVKSGTASTSVIFYNFESAGQKQVDNIVAEFEYEDTVTADLEFFEDGSLAAFSDGGVYLFSGGSSPEEKAYVAASGEIISVFYDESYFGLVYTGSDGTGRLIKIYDTSADEVSQFETDILYDSIGFLKGHEICLYDDYDLVIFRKTGSVKFEYQSDEEICGIVHIFGYRRYAVLFEGRTDIVMLTLFDEQEETVEE